MSYMKELRESNPGLENFSDAEIAQHLPDIDPEMFAGKSPEESLSLATQDNNFIADAGRLFWAGAKETTGQALTALELATGSDWQVDDDLIQSGKETYQNVDPLLRHDIEKAGFQDESENTVAGVAGALAKSGGSMVPYAVAQTGAALTSPFTGGASTLAAPAAVNAAVIAGGNYHSVKDQIDSLSYEELEGSELFANYLARSEKFAQGDDAKALARAQMADDLARDAATEGAWIGGLSGAVLGPALSKMFRGGQGALKGAGTGAAAEGTQEFVESGAESYAVESARSEATGSDVDYNRVVRDAAFGAVLGAGAGGTLGAATGALAPTPIERSQEHINEAVEKAAADGGDSLDQAVAGGKAQAETVASAVSESKAQAKAKASSRDMSGLDGLIIVARREGFAEEEARLTNAKNLYERALQHQQAGDITAADRLQQKADQIVRDVSQVNEPIKQEAAANFPVPFMHQGTIEGTTDLVPGRQPASESVIEGETITDPQRLDYQTALLADQRGVNRLENAGVIYGEEPVEVTATRQQREADNFNAFYGQEGQANFQLSTIEGELDRSNELPDNRAKRLPPGTGQIDLGQQRPDRQFKPVDPVYSGVGENIVQRQAGDKAALPRPSTISPDQYRELQAIQRQAVRTPVSKRTEEQLQAVAVVSAVKSGSIKVAEPAKIKPQSRGKSSQVDTSRHTFAQAIALSGGLSREAAQDMGVDPAHFADKRGGVFGKPLFRKNGGLSEGELFEVLSQQGMEYIQTQEEFRERLFDHLGGKAHYTAEGYVRQAEDEAMLREQFEEGAEPIIEGQTSEESILSVAVDEARQAGVAESRIHDILQTNDNELDVALELRNEIDQLHTQGLPAGNGSEGRGQTEAAAGEFPAGESTSPEQVWGTEDFELNSYTEADISAQEQAIADADASAATQQKTAQAKADADSQVNDFTLTGSDRTADVAAARGQNDMFGVSSSESKPAQLAEGIDPNVLDDMESRRDDAAEYVEQLQAELNAAFEAGRDIPSWTETGRSNRSSSLNKQSQANSDKQQKIYSRLQDAEKEYKRLSGLASGYRTGRTHANGQPKSQKEATGKLNLSYADYIKSKVSPGDSLWFLPNPSVMVVKRLNKNTITVSSGTKWDYLDFAPMIDGRSMTQAEIKKDMSQASRPETVAEDSALKILPSDHVPDSSAKDLKAGPYPLGYHNAIAKAAREGTLELKDFQHGLETLLASEAEVKSRLNKYAKPVLMNISGRMYWNKSDYNKGQVLEHAWERIVDFYLLDKQAPTTTVYGVGDMNAEGLKKKAEEKKAKIIELAKSNTQADLKAYAEQYAEQVAEHKQRQADKEKALSNPETLEEFKAFISAKGEQALTSEQLATHDDLVTADAIEKADKRIQKQSQVSGVDGDVSYETDETIHSKTGEHLFVVKLTGERLDKAFFKELVSKAKKLGGYYSSFRGKGAIPGFQFKSDTDRDNFVAVLKGEGASSIDKVSERAEQKKDARTNKLLELAERAESRGMEKLNQDRLTNTARRATMAASVVAQAESEVQFARLIREIAQATENGELKILSNLSTATQLNELNYIQSRLLWKADKDLVKKNDFGRREWKSDTTVDQKLKAAELTKPMMSVSVLKDAAKAMAEVSGYKQVAKSIQSRIKSKQSDTRVDLSSYQWEKLLPKIKQFASQPSASNSSIGRYAAERIKEEVLSFSRLEKMGITSLPMLRQALRELYKMDSRVESPVAEKTKLERLEHDLKMKVLNNRKAFIDFFPTPAETAGEVIDIADVQQGMKVLEPSAGNGMLADAMKATGAEVDVVELAIDLREILAEKGFNIVEWDFLELEKKPVYDRVVMNPPFSKDQDIKHVAHAYEMLKPGGRMVAIVSSTAGDRQNKNNKAFREWIEELAADEMHLPDGAFKSSLNPTGVNTKIVVIDKPGDGSIDAPRFSRTSAGADVVESSSGNLKPHTGLTVDAVKSAVVNVRKRLALRGVRINVVGTESELPGVILKQAEEDGAQGEIGAVYHEKAIYVVADRMASVSEVETAIFHEAGHYGGRALFGKDLMSAYRKLWMKIGGVKKMKTLAEEAGLGADMKPYFETADRGIQDGSLSAAQRAAYLVDEFIAHLNQKQATEKLPAKINRAIQEFVGAFRNALRKFGFAELPDMSQADLAYLLKRINKAGQGETDVNDRPFFMRVSEQDEQLLFLNELADELEIEEAGQPMFSRKSRSRAAEQFTDLNEDQTSFLGKIAPKTTTQRIKDRIAEALDRGGLKVRQGMVDRYTALFELDKQAQGEEVVENNTRMSSWVLAKMSHAADGALSALMSFGRIRFSDGVIQLQNDQDESGGLMGVLSKLGSGSEVERFMGWIAANRSAKLSAEGRENLFTEEEIAAGIDLNKGETAEGKQREALYEEVFSEFQQYRDDVLKIAQEAGIISENNYDMWKDEFYVPFYRVMEEQDVNGPRMSGGLSRQQAYKKLKGGSQELNDLLENTLLNFQHLLSSSLKNNAASQAIDNAVKVGIAEQTSESARDKKASTFVLEGGEKRWYNISDPLVFESLTSLNDAATSTFSRKLMRAFKRIFTSFITSSPQFMVANGIRDTLHAMAIGNLSYNGFKNFAGGLKDYGSPVHKGKLKGQMMATGASFSFGHVYGSGDADALHAELERTIKGAKVLRDPKDVPGMIRQAWDFYSGFGDAAENANRTSMYKQNLEKGELYAAFQARDLMDFSSHGAWPAVRFLVDTVPFLNARLIGLDRMYRGGVKPTVNVIKQMLGGEAASMTDKQAAQRFAIVTGALTAASIALYLHNKDDEEFQKLEDWQRDMYWFVRVGDSAYFIPKPFEIGAIATVAERGLEQMVDDTKDGKLFLERMGHVVTDTFAFNPVPQMFKPVLDVYANKSSFTGRDIETMGMDRLSKVNRYRTNTTDGAKYISQMLDSTVGKVSENLVISPVQADYLIQQYLGWVGTMGATTVDIISKQARGHEDPAKDWTEHQPIRRFFRDTSNPSYTRYGTEFYDALRETNRVYADIKHLRKMGEDAAAAELAAENGNKLKLRSVLNKANKTLSKLNTRSKLIQRNSKLSAEEKRQRLDAIQKQRNIIQERIVKRLEKI